jgi:hypothetical protein
MKQARAGTLSAVRDMSPVCDHFSRSDEVSGSIGAA